MRLAKHMSLALVAIALVVCGIAQASPSALAAEEVLPLVAKDVQMLEARMPAAKKKSGFGSLSRQSKPPKVKKQKKIFCDRFRQACIDATMDGKTNYGNYTIVYSCKRFGKKKSSQYTFGCRLNNNDFTAATLRRLAYRAGNVTDGATVYVTTSDTKTIFDVQTSVLTSTVATVTATSTATSLTTESTTVTDAQVDTQQFPAITYDVIPPYPNPNTRRRAADDEVDICPAYRTSCAKECKRVKSKPKYQRCKNLDGASRYSLSCICKNGKTETQHALTNIGQEDAVPVSTNTVTVASTSTVNVPVVTVTTAPVTAQETTATSTVTTTTVTSTTVFAVAPTGNIRMVMAGNTNQQAYVTEDANSYGVSNYKDGAATFLISRDADSGMLKFVSASTSWAVGGENPTPSEVTFAQGSSAYVDISGQEDVYTAPGPAVGQGGAYGNPFETWISSEIRLPPSGIASEPVEIFGAYINPDGTRYASQPDWFYDGGLHLVADGTQANDLGQRVRIFYEAANLD